MIIKCPNCTAQLNYDTTSGSLNCEYCGSKIDVDAFREGEGPKFIDIEEVKEAVGEESVTYNAYACSECGATITSPSTQFSTFCAFCGQNSVAFSKKMEAKVPDKLIPFKVDKNQAIEIIKKQLLKGMFVPKGMKKFELERVIGLYVPFDLLDADMSLYQTREYKSGKNHVKKKRETKFKFHNLPVDTSRKLNDTTSGWLDPYDMKELRDYGPAYMAGYFADVSDEDNQYQLDSKYYHRANEISNLAISSHSGGRLIDEICAFDIKRQTKAMLPVWMMTLRYNDTPYTFMVNGQTGKAVGASPIDKKRAIGATMLVFAPALVVGSLMVQMLFSLEGESAGDMLQFFIVGGVALAAWGRSNMKKLTTNLSLSQKNKSLIDMRKDV